MKPWRLDAGSIDIGELVEEDARRGDSHKLLITPTGNSEMRDFVRNPNIGSSLRVVVAPKGYGKTLLLRYRAQWLRQNYKDRGIVFFPSGAHDIEYLQVLLEPDDMYRIIVPIPSPEHWSRIWECALLVTACHACGATSLESAELDSLFPYKPSKLTLSGVLATVLRSMEDREHLLSSDIETLRSVFADIGNDTVVFVDNADEAFQIHRNSSAASKRLGGDSEASDKDYVYDFAQDSPRSWNDLQVGLLLAVRSIARHTKGLHVYTSLRAEALNGLTEPTTLQARDHCADLKYSKASLQRIFNANIEMYDNDDLVDPSAEDPIQRWLGVRNLPHPYVTNPAGIPENEDLFDFLLRHSMHSPRDLMILGGEISKNVPMEIRRDPELVTETLQKCVNAVAKDKIFVQWKETAIPRWSEYYFKAVGSTKCNALSKDDLTELDTVVDIACGSDKRKPIPYSQFMYQHGLLGYSLKYPKQPHQQMFQVSWDQRFNGHGDQSRDSGTQVVPTSEYYFVHPILNDVIRHHAQSGTNFLPNEDNIIGYNLKFNVEAPTVIIMPGRAVWPALKCSGQLIFDGSRNLSLPQLGFLTLLFAAREHNDVCIPIATIVDVYNKIVEKFGTPRKNWIGSLESDPGHLNKSISSLLGKTGERHVVSCNGRDRKLNLPAMIELKLCNVQEIYIEQSVAL